jgi:hypothetical protein
MSNLATGNAKHAIAARGNDLYQTPPEAVRALLKVENVPQRVWEPACGPGSIVRVLRESGRLVLATDLVDYGSPDQNASGVDFLIPGIAESYALGAWPIVTNPPFKNAESFIARALALSPYVAMLLRLGFLESEKRRGILEQSHLARVYVFRNRLPMMHRHGWDGPKGGSAIAYAWFIWDRSHRGPTQLHRISWEAA